MLYTHLTKLGYFLVTDSCHQIILEKDNTKINRETGQLTIVVIIMMRFSPLLRCFSGSFQPCRGNFPLHFPEDVISTKDG